jgi:hypothetical protein
MRQGILSLLMAQGILSLLMAQGEVLDVLVLMS